MHESRSAQWCTEHAKSSQCRTLVSSCQTTSQKINYGIDSNQPSGLNASMCFNFFNADTLRVCQKFKWNSEAVNSCVRGKGIRWIWNQDTYSGWRNHCHWVRASAIWATLPSKSYAASVAAADAASTTPQVAASNAQVEPCTGSGCSSFHNSEQHRCLHNKWSQCLCIKPCFQCLQQYDACTMHMLTQYAFGF